MEKNLDQSIDAFMNATSPSTASVIIPLFGYWADIKNNPFLKEHVLSIVMKRVQSSTHHLALIFVAHPESIENNPKDPQSVSNVILSYNKGGNVKNIPVSRNAPYPEYIAKGMDYALNETKAQFVVIVNPWSLLQYDAIDAVIDRANRADEAYAISGYNVSEYTSPEGFDSFQDAMLPEMWDIDFSLFCMPRFAAEMVNWDSGYKTHKFLEQDIAQSMKNSGFASIAYPQAGVFPFNFPWSTYESNEDINEDQQKFAQKWGFTLE